MSPEEREIEQAAAEVSARYRVAATDEPSARIDAAILQAAREETSRRKGMRVWRVPAAVAAVVVIGVSLSLMTHEVIDPLPPPGPSGSSAGLANSNGPSPAMEAGKPPAKAKADLGARPSRERSDRSDRESERRQGEPAAAPPPSPATPEAVGQIANQAAIAPPAPAPSVAQYASTPAQDVAARVSAAPASAVADSASHDKLAEKKAEAREEVAAVRTLRKERAAAEAEVLAPEAWIRKIERLVAEGREPEARAQVAEFRKRYPDHRLPDALRPLGEPVPGQEARP